MKDDQCLFCKSRKCYDHIISSTDQGKAYNQVACHKHIRQLEQHSDQTAPGIMKLFISSTAPVSRSDKITDHNQLLKDLK